MLDSINLGGKNMCGETHVLFGVDLVVLLS
jgi:hypothetical protein